MKCPITILICVIFIGVGNSIMLKKECPSDEVHRSCSFYEEYTCWSDEDRRQRVKIVPPKLEHCKSGCFCRKGFVREYPRGSCIIAAACKDNNLTLKLLENLPKELLSLNSHTEDYSS